MPNEAVDVRTETTLNISSLEDLVTSREAEYGLVGTQAYFPHEFTRARGNMGPAVDDRFVATCAIIAATAEANAKSVSVEKNAAAAISSVIEQTYAGQNPADRPPLVELDRAFKTVVLKAREFDRGWDSANALWKQYEAMAIPAKDSDKIGGNEVRRLQDVFGPAVIEYGKLIAEKILAQPDTVPAPPMAPQPNPIALEEIIEQVDADIQAGANPQAVFVGLCLRDDVALTGTAFGALAGGQEAIVRARKFVGGMIFRNFGGASAANHERFQRSKAALMAPPNNYSEEKAEEEARKSKLRNVNGEDPWSSPKDPLGYEHFVLKKYQAGNRPRILGQDSIESAYLYLRQRYGEKLPWEALVDAYEANGQVVPHEFDVVAVGGQNILFSLYDSIKACQRSMKIVSAMQEVMDGGDKVLDVLAGVVSRFRMIGGDRAGEAAELLARSFDILKERKQPPPFKGDQLEQLNKSVLKSEGMFITGSNYRKVFGAYDANVRRAGESRGFGGDMAVAFINLVQTLVVDKPNYIK